jgi:hypothetical protein
VTKTYGILDAFNRFMASTVLARTFPINELKEGIDILLKSNYESKKAVRKSRNQQLETAYRAYLFLLCIEHHLYLKQQLYCNC